MTASNSAAQVSTSLKTARIPRRWRSRRTSASVVFQRRRELPVGEAVPLGLAASSAVAGLVEALNRAEPAFERDQLVDVGQEPGVDPRQRVDLLDGQPRQQGVADRPDPLGVGGGQLALISCSLGCAGVPQRSFLSQPRPNRPTSSPRSAFCSDSLNVRPIAMTSPTDFICVVKRPGRPRGTSRTPSAGSWSRRSRSSARSRRGSRG